MLQVEIRTSQQNDKSLIQKYINNNSVSQEVTKVWRNNWSDSGCGSDHPVDPGSISHQSKREDTDTHNGSVDHLVSSTVEFFQDFRDIREKADVSAAIISKTEELSQNLMSRATGRRGRCRLILEEPTLLFSSTEMDDLDWSFMRLYFFVVVFLTLSGLFW